MILLLRCGDGEDDVYECEIEDETKCPIGLVNELRGELGHFPKEEIDLREFGVTPVGWLCELVRQLQIVELPTRIEDPKTYVGLNYNANCAMALSALKTRLAKRYDQFKHRDDFGQTIVTFYHLLRYVMMPEFIIDMGKMVLATHIEQVIESFPCLNIPPEDPSWGCLPSEFNCDMQKAYEIYRTARGLHINELDPNRLSDRMMEMFTDLNGQGWKGDWEDFGKKKSPNHDELEGYNFLSIEERLMWCKRVLGQPEWTLNILDTITERKRCQRIIDDTHKSPVASLVESFPPSTDSSDITLEQTHYGYIFDVGHSKHSKHSKYDMVVVDLAKDSWETLLFKGLSQWFVIPCWVVVIHDGIWVLLDFNHKRYFIMDLPVFCNLAKSLECPLLLSFFWAVFSPDAYHQNLMTMMPSTRQTSITNLIPNDLLIRIKEGLKGVIMTPPPLDLSIDEWMSVLSYRTRVMIEWNSKKLLTLIRSHPLIAYMTICFMPGYLYQSLSPGVDPSAKRYVNDVLKLMDKFYLTIPDVRTYSFWNSRNDLLMSSFWMVPSQNSPHVVLKFGSDKEFFHTLVESVVTIMPQIFIDDLRSLICSSKSIMDVSGGFRAANVKHLSLITPTGISEIFTSLRVLEMFKEHPDEDSTSEILEMLSLFQIGKERAMTILKVFDFNSDYFFYLLNKKLPKSATYQLLVHPKNLIAVAKNCQSFTHLQKVHELCEKSECSSEIITYPMLRQQLARAAQFAYWEGAITFLRPHLLKSESQFSDVLSCWKIPYSPSNSHSISRKPTSHSGPRKRKS